MDDLEHLHKVSSVRRQSAFERMPSYDMVDEFEEQDAGTEADTDPEQELDVDLEEANNQDNAVMSMLPRTLPKSNISRHLQSIRLRNGLDDNNSATRTSNDSRKHPVIPRDGFSPNSHTLSTPGVNSSDHDTVGDNPLEREDTLSTWQRAPTLKLLRASTYPETEEEQKQTQFLHEQETYKLVVPPNVDSQERLWQEVAHLDEIKKFARELKFSTSMFPKGFEENLGELKKLQNSLVYELRNYNAELEEQERIDIAKQAAADILTFTPPNSLEDSSDSMFKSSSAIRLGGFGSNTNLKAEKYLRELFEKIKEIDSPPIWSLFFFFFH